jgi:hypothetical protein
MNIISVSRRTDIPAYQMPWFIQQINDKSVQYKNPFNQKLCSISLAPEDVIAFVFWSKDFSKFINYIPYLKDRKYNYYLQYTINNYLSPIENIKPSLMERIDIFKLLVDKIGYEYVQWRYDPIIITSEYSLNWHLEQIDIISRSLEGYTNRCYFSYISMYKKVISSIMNYNKSSLKTKIELFNIDIDIQISFSKRIYELLSLRGIDLFSCCGEHLINQYVKKASCIDGELISRLFPYVQKVIKQSPTRNGCGCVVSKDIGTYRTCGHQCIYCYAQ